MSVHQRSVLLVAVLATVFLSNQAAIASGKPPGREGAFVPGQVAVYATPAELVDETVVKVLPYAGITVIAVRRGQEHAVVSELLREGFQADVNRVLRASEVPNDPYYGYQWHLPAIQSEQAWDLSHGEGVTVAVTDTGLATGGPDGIGCVSPDGYDVVNQDDDPDDGDGHGTHVSGTIAQATNNHIGVSGMAQGACVLPIKVLDDNASGTTSDVAEGIFYAVEKGASVINMSLGISAESFVTSDRMMDPALDYAYSQGVTVVCSAGNEAVRSNVGYPAIYPTTIAVGATDAVNALAPYSNAGLGLDMVAPGGDMRVDLNGDGYKDGVLQETRINGDWGYYFFQGTSMAAPHVAAVAAMLIAQEVATTPAEVYDAITSTALDLGESGYDSVYGYGLVQAYDALTEGISEPPVCTDVDGDGVCLEEGDCNDLDATVYPGAYDSKSWRDNNNVDNDCDGRIDR